MLVTLEAELELFDSKEIRESLLNTKGMHLQFVFKFFKEYVKRLV